MVRAGRVSVDGKIQSDPETPLQGTQHQIMVDGVAIDAQNKIYLMMNKPRGVVTTASDEKGRKTVYELLNPTVEDRENSSKKLPWVAPVGRLDKASEGLLLLTNDSEWGARITAPKTHLEKTYHVQVDVVADENLIAALLREVKSKTEEGLRAKRVVPLRAGQKTCWLEIVLTEGKNRQIRRMMAALSVEVLRLVRVAIGPLRLGALAKGACRTLTSEEKRMLDRSMKPKKTQQLGR